MPFVIARWLISSMAGVSDRTTWRWESADTIWRISMVLPLFSPADVPSIITYSAENSHAPMEHFGMPKPMVRMKK